MTQQEIQYLNEELSVRNLISVLRTRMQVLRPGIATDTITRALKITDYDEASPLLRRILNEAKSVLEQDNQRIANLKFELQA